MIAAMGSSVSKKRWFVDDEVLGHCRQENVIGALRDLFDELIAQQYMRPVAPNSTLTMARCCWMLWLSWLRFEHIANPMTKEPGDAAIYDGIALNLTIAGSYFSADFSAVMEAELRKALPGSLKKPAGPKARATKIQARSIGHSGDVGLQSPKSSA